MATTKQDESATSVAYNRKDESNSHEVKRDHDGDGTADNDEKEKEGPCGLPAKCEIL